MGAQYIVVKRFSAENFVPSKAVPKMALFRELWGVNVIFLFTNPEKAHLCAAARCLTYRFRGLAVERWKNLSEKKKLSTVNIFVAQFRTYGEKKPLKGS